MIIDKKQYKELIKVDGGSLGHDCNISVNIKEAPDLKKEISAVLKIYPKRLYFDIPLGDKMCFLIEDLKDVRFEDGIIEIYMKNEEIIKIKIAKEKEIIKVYNALGKHLELGLENLNGEVSQVKIENEYKREEKRIERAIKEEEKERKRKGYERIMDSNQDGGTKDDSVVRCPKCGSISITANKKGFSLAKGALGVATVGAYGVLAAGHGKNKVLVTCLKCGHQWKPGK
ncbi:MAG: hypothetical protein RSA29_10455 [Clostridium sp.]|uniref:hypothetical protein n=1 Tax=Clostridium sp. TaxID=1506 RepID=UPI0032175989